MTDGCPRRRRSTVCSWAAGLVLCAASAGAQPADLSLIDVVKHAGRGSSHAAISALLEAGADVNAAEPDGTTALHWAVQHDDQDVVQALIAAGAAVDTANRFGVTPLALAATNGSATMVDELLQAGASPDAPSPGGDTPLMLAARTGRADVVGLLLTASADVDATEQWKGQNALMWAAAEGHAEVITALAAAGTWVETRSWSDVSPLMFAVREGHADGVQALLAAGADVNAPGDGDTSPLGLAIINAHYGLAEMLLNAGADPNADDPRGSLLHALSWMRRPGAGRPPIPTGTLDSLELARALLDAGADTAQQIGWNETTEDGKPRSMREAMEVHRANPACASCHSQMDPLGFALENFDAIGRWRDRGESNLPIDASGLLPNGTRFDGPSGLRAELVKSPKQFMTTMTDKLFTYALGRGVESFDAPTIRAIVRDAERDEYRFASVVSGIVNSMPFQMRKAQ